MLISTFTLIVLTLISLIIAKFFPRISVNYISMFVGIIGVLIPFVDQHIAEFRTEVFMVLMVAPLLFFEGMRTAFGNLRFRIGQIIQITVIMVVLCTLVAGFTLHFALGLSLPLAFVMAAISTPTDATATDSVTLGLKMPRESSRLLKLESLFNDASGLILLEATALWLVQGRLEYQRSIVSFLISAIGGILLALILTQLIINLRQLLLRHINNSITAQTVLYIMTPYFIYLAAEELNISGIIAVVVAGILHNAEARSALFVDSRQSFVGGTASDIISELLNGSVFVILGVMVVRILREYLDLVTLVTFVLAGTGLYLGNLLVRYLYARYSLKLTNKDSAVFSLGGVHGAVTLALVFSLKSFGVSEEDFSLILLSEFMLIVLSMVVPTILFRFILPKKSSEAEILEKMNKARQGMVKAGIAEVEKMYLPDRIKQIVINSLRDQSRETTLREFGIRFRRTLHLPEIDIPMARRLRLRVYVRCFEAERNYLIDLAQKEENDSEYLATLYEEVLLAETIINNRFND